jgi:hypothetical protein
MARPFAFGEAGVSNRSWALVALVALAAGAAALVVVELLAGARSYGSLETKPACGAHVDFPGEGLDPALQRLVLNGLYGAACELGASREELVLAFVPGTGEAIRWDDATVQRAVRAGLVNAVEAERDRGAIGPTTARILVEVAERLPVTWLVDRIDDVRALLREVEELGADLQGALDAIRDLELGGLLDDLLGGAGLGGSGS